MIRAQAGQSAAAQMVSATTGAAFTGTVTVYITIDNGTQTLGSVGSGICTHEGNGLHSYNPSAQETDGAVIAFTFIGTGAIPATVQYPTITLAQQQSLISSSVTGAEAVSMICDDAAAELNIIMEGESLNANDGARILRRLNRIIDNWNAQREAVYGIIYSTFTTVPSLRPHTIGPSSATWTTTQRPVSIESASLVLPTSPAVLQTITIRPIEWYDALSIPDLTTLIPTDLFYNPTWPNGELYFYPVPAGSYDVILMSRVLLARVSMSDVITLPPGYLDALTLTLAEAIATPFGRKVPDETEKLAREGRARIFANNDRVPPLITADAGMPGSGSKASNKTYLTGWQ